MTFKDGYERVKLHVKEHKKEYLIGAGGVVVGAGIVMIFKQRPMIINTIAPIFNNNNSSAVNFGGHMTKLVKCLETGEMWETVTEAAKSAGTSLPAMSKHLNGHSAEHLYGMHYAIIGVGTTG